MLIGASSQAAWKRESGPENPEAGVVTGDPAAGRGQSAIEHPRVPSTGRNVPVARWAEVTRFVVKAIGVAAVVTVPIALLDVDAFWRSAIMLQLREPFRLDSLSFTRELLQFGIPVDKQGAMAVSLSAGLAGIGLAWWRAPRTPAGFAASLGVTCFLLTAFGKKAFLNYYFLVVAFLLVAIAATPAPTARRS
jgi:hypothetical protein